MSAEADMSMGETPSRQAYSSNKTNEAAFAVLDELRQQNQLCDVIIRVGDQDFVAHRVVLAATCPYFKGMFTGGRQVLRGWCIITFYPEGTSLVSPHATFLL